MKKVAAFAPLILAVVACAVSAQSTTVYKWTDGAGTVHYTDQPPPNERSSQLQLHAKSGMPSDSGPAATGPAKQTSADTKLAVAEAATRVRNCENARANTATLAGNAMLVDGSDPATARKMDQDELEAARKNAQRDVASWCDGGAK